MKNSINILAVSLTLFWSSVLYAQINEQPIGDPRQESASVEISLFQGQLDFLINGVNDGVDALSVDWDKIDENIVKWFDAKKVDPASRWEPLRRATDQKYNELVEETKTSARSQVSLMVSAWNEAVRDGGKKLSAAIELLWQTGPYGKVVGVYRYTQGAEDPGDPGWELEESVLIYNFTPVETSSSYGLEEIEVKATASLDAIVAGASAEVITKLKSQFSLNAFAKLPYQLAPPQQPLNFKPLPADPLNKPIASTGFQSSIAAGFIVSYDISALLKIDGWLSVGPILVDLGIAIADIEKGKHKKVSANP